jgi:hypothetical protein
LLKTNEKFRKLIFILYSNIFITNKTSYNKAIVAPIVLPNDTKIKPYQNPNNAPPIKVRPRANGNDKK